MYLISLIIGFLMILIPIILFKFHYKEKTISKALKIIFSIVVILGIVLVIYSSILLYYMLSGKIILPLNQIS